MPKISVERLASNVRVAAVRVAVVGAVGRVLDEHPDLTHEEILSALLVVAQRHAELLLEPEDPSGGPLGSR